MEINLLEQKILINLLNKYKNISKIIIILTFLNKNYLIYFKKKAVVADLNFIEIDILVGDSILRVCKSIILFITFSLMI